MYDSWIPVAYSIIAALAAGFSAWIASKKAITPIVGKVEKVIEQNMVQEKKLDGVHENLNSRLDEWRSEVNIHIATAIREALARGIAQGVAQERNRVTETAAQVLEKAQLVAEQVVETAKEAATDVLITAKK